MSGIKARLSTMMFLEFFVWGAWYTTVAVYMAAEGLGDLTHWPYTVNPLAAIIAPFFLGLVADRYFAAQKVFGVLHLIGVEGGQVVETLDLPMGSVLRLHASASGNLLAAAGPRRVFGCPCRLVLNLAEGNSPLDQPRADALENGHGVRAYRNTLGLTA